MLADLQRDVELGESDHAAHVGRARLQYLQSVRAEPCGMQHRAATEVLHTAACHISSRSAAVAILACVQMSRARRKLFCFANCSATKCSCATCAARGAIPSRGDNHIASPRTLALLADPAARSAGPRSVAQRSAAACGWGHDSFPAVPAHTQPTGRRRRSTPAWARGRAALISPPYSSAQSADHAHHAEKRRAAQGVRARRPGR